jgi:beta-N-acetylhexosaminidase
MPVSAFVCGCAGLSLTAWEKSFFEEAQPWGLILFKRNVDNPAQLSALTASFRHAVGRSDAPVFIDQEGGRVQRLGPPHWPVYPSGASYLRALGDVEAAAKLVRLTAQLMASDLLAVGITVDCLPVLDVTYPQSHKVIGDRSYGSHPAAVARLGRAAADGLLAAGVLPVIKHLPGHGRARADSHLELPVVDAALRELEADFAPFIANADLPIGMSAHVVYPALDVDHPATTSRKIVADIIRGQIGFDGLLLSDDLSMQALSGTLRERARAALKAGIDIVLHCNGKPEEMEEVAGVTPPLAGCAAERAERALSRLRPPAADFDPVDARARLNSALAMAV